MAYDEGLAQRVREVIEGHSMADEKKMFGDVGFMIEGNIACGVLKDELIVRVGPRSYQAALEHRHIREFDITGRSMKGWIMVQAESYESDQALKEWVERGIEFALTLLPK